MTLNCLRRWGRRFGGLGCNLDTEGSAGMSIPPYLSLVPSIYQNTNNTYKSTQNQTQHWTINITNFWFPNITKNSPPSNSFKLIQFRHLSNVNSALLKPGSLHHQNTYKLHKNTGLYITNFNQISPKTLHLQTASN